MNSRESSSDDDTFFVCPTCDRWYRDELDVCPEDGTKLRRARRPSDSLVGETLADRFVIDGVIGEGGMGTVYRATQHPIGRPVAIKVLHKRLVKDTNLVKRFLNEAQAASALVNPNTVTIHDFGQTPDGSLFIAMEHLVGETLADREARRPLEVSHALEIAAQVCRALSEAHRKEIVHRDLKPENIMLTAADDGSLLVKVVDFGIAKVLRPTGISDAGVPITEVGTVIGTPRYMSPEQARGKTPSPASDLYALGVILFEMIAGHAPFEHEKIAVLVGMHMEKTPPPLASPLEPIDEKLAALVEALLAKATEDRPPAAEDVGATLRELLGSTKIMASDLLDDAGSADAGDLLTEATSQAEPLRPEDVQSTTSEALELSAPATVEDAEAVASGVGSETIEEPLATPSVDQPPPRNQAVDTLQPLRASPSSRRLVIAAAICGALVLIGAGIGLWHALDREDPDEHTQLMMDEGLIGTSREEPVRHVQGKTAPGNEGWSASGEQGGSDDLIAVELESEPAGAEVSYRGRRLCFTPCTHHLPRGKRFPLRFRLRGYRMTTMSVVPVKGVTVNVELEPSLSRQ